MRRWWRRRHALVLNAQDLSCFPTKPARKSTSPCKFEECSLAATRNASSAALVPGSETALGDSELFIASRTAGTSSCGTPTILAFLFFFFIFPVDDDDFPLLPLLQLPALPATVGAMRLAAELMRLLLELLMSLH